MPRTAICIVCAALAAIAALVVLFAPSPAYADKPPAAATIGDGEAAIGTIRFRALMMGGDKPLAGFKLMVMAKLADRTSITREVLTDDQGEFRLTLRVKPSELRVFPFGEFLIPDGWSHVPLPRFKFEAEETWELRVRSLKNVVVQGRVTLAEGKRPAPRANVMLAPLDVSPDGSATSFDNPIGALADADGNFRYEVPPGTYMVWAYWTDRSSADWVGHIQVIKRVDVFAETRLDLLLAPGPELRGKVIDARTGEGVAATIDLFTNLHLRQLRNSAADGEFPDVYLPDGKEIRWPVGTFKFRAWMVDPDDFTAVIRPQGSSNVLAILPNLRAADLVGKDLVWPLYTDKSNVVDIRVTTHVHELPINNIDVQLVPRDIDAPRALRLSLNASGRTDPKGETRFVGLPRGEYEAFGAGGSNFLGMVKVTGEAAQNISLKIEVPFVFGVVKLPDGTPCRNMKAFFSLTNPEGRVYGPYPSDAFSENPDLRALGRVLLPLTQRGMTYTLRFAAFEDGREFKDSEWVNLASFPLVTESREFKVETEEAWEIDLTLKPNPDYKREE